MTDIGAVRLSADIGAVQSAAVIPLTASIVTTVSTGVMPLYVHFDATATTSPNTTRPFDDLHYAWDFDDSGGRHNAQTGAVAAHVFDAVGVYTVTLTVTDPTDGEVSIETVDITVTSDDAEYPTTDTICFSNTADFTDAPAGSTQVTTSSFTTAMSTYFAAGKRLLFKRGDTFASTTLSTLVGDPADFTQLGAFGTGTSPDSKGVFSNDPIIEVADLIDCIDADTGGVTLWHLNFTAASGADCKVAVNTNGGQVTDLLCYQCSVTRTASESFEGSFNATPWSYYTPVEAAHERIAVVDCWSSDRVYGAGRHSAYIGVTVTTSQSHSLRLEHAWKTVIANCDLLTPGLASVYHNIKLHASQASIDPMYDDYTEHVVITNNIFRAQDSWAVAVAVQSANPSYNEPLRNILIERNTIHMIADCSVGVYCSASNSTVRNNVFNDLLGTENNTTWVYVDRRSTGSPQPVGVRVFNNTASSTVTKSEMFFCWAPDAAVTVDVKNNIHYAPDATSADLTKGSATFNTATNLETDPLFVDAPSGDLRIQATSDAVDAATVDIVFDDFTGVSRASIDAVAPDIGAYEYTLSVPVIEMADINTHQTGLPKRQSRTFDAALELRSAGSAALTSETTLSPYVVLGVGCIATMVIDVTAVTGDAVLTIVTAESAAGANAVDNASYLVPDGDSGRFAVPISMNLRGTLDGDSPLLYASLKVTPGTTITLSAYISKATNDPS